MSFENSSLWTLGLFFAAAGTAVWFAGTKLATCADVIAERTGLGRAFVGLLLLATATSLPELATTITAGRLGNAPLLTGNLLGGIAMQTAILAVMDLLLVRKGPLAYFAEPRLLIDGVMLVALLAFAMAGMALDGQFAFWGMGPTPLLAAVLFVLMLWTTHMSHPRWKATNPPGAGDPPAHAAGREESGALPKEQTAYRDVSNARLYLVFAAGAAAILVAGYVLARSGDAIATRTGIGSTMIGAVLVALGTSLPEISTTVRAVRLGAHEMAISNIFGSNAFCVALLLVGDVAYRDGPILAAASPSDRFLTALGILLTCAYLWGMLERKNRTVFGMGVASLVVLVLYVGGLVVTYYAT